VAQGLGQVLGEHILYDETGQLLTASFMDYMLPRATTCPPCASPTTSCHARRIRSA